VRAPLHGRQPHNNQKASGGARPAAMSVFKSLLDEHQAKQSRLKEEVGECKRKTTRTVFWGPGSNGRGALPSSLIVYWCTRTQDISPPAHVTSAPFSPPPRRGVAPRRVGSRERPDGESRGLRELSRAWQMLPPPHVKVPFNSTGKYKTCVDDAVGKGPG
jgi:hypothetical protein